MRSKGLSNNISHNLYRGHIATDVHPKLKNKKAMKALIVLAFSLIGKFFSRDYSYVPTWQCLR